MDSFIDLDDFALFGSKDLIFFQASRLYSIFNFYFTITG